MDEGEVVVKLRLKRGVYEKLRSMAESSGYSTVVEFLESVASSLAEGRALPAAAASGDVEQVARRLERMVADLLNPFTGKIDEALRRLSQIQELLEARHHPVEEPRAEAEALGVKRGLTALERLRRDGAVFMEDVRWMRAPDRLFDKLKREGALVIEHGGEKVAVDREFWRRFREEVESVSVKSVEDASELVGMSLGETATRLFKKLAKLGLLVYDEDEGRWVVRVHES